MFRLICVSLLLWRCATSSLEEMEKKMNDSGIDIVKLHNFLKKESAEVEEEFGTKQMQKEIAELRENYKKHLIPGQKDDNIETELEINGDASNDMFEGDIELTPEQWKIAFDMDPNNPLQRRQALANEVKLWKPIGAPIIPYGFVDGFPADQKPLIKSAIDFWESITCIKFRPMTATDTNVVMMNHDSKVCSSSVGIAGGKQNVNLGPGCMTFTIAAHEISHAFGTLHVQSRSDRDEYVRIDKDNIKEGKEHNFAKEPEGYGALSNYGIPYEFGSMQHYHESAFQKNGSTTPTIYAQKKYLDWQFSMEGPRATFYDTLLVNSIYKCTDKCKNKIVCKNNGVQHGSDCTKCFCPRGWSGTNCEKRPSDAETIKIDKDQVIMVQIPAGTDGVFREKLYIFEAPAGKKIQVTKKQLGERSNSMCRAFGIEIITNKDTRMAGYRMCSHTIDYPTVTSEDNSLLIWIYNERTNMFYVQLDAKLV